MIRLYEKCELCERKCGKDRLSGEKGYCGMSAPEVRIARVGLHMWEEPCISGTRGSGTVFFSGCNLGCIYCQNIAISKGQKGRTYTTTELAESFYDLEMQGAHNINLVTPTHYMPSILEAIDIARGDPERRLELPFVYNCGGYENPDMIPYLKGYIDVFMPDVKYHSDTLSVKYSNAPGYYKAAMKNVERMLEIAPEPVFNGEGLMTSGVLVRHLILPTRVSDSLRIIKGLWHRFGNDICLSLMNQYTPMDHFEKYPELSLTLSESSYDKAVECALSLGFKNVNIQEGGTASESFIPPFD